MSKDEKIDAYLKGELKGEERERFEQRMKTDKNLAGDVELYALIYETLNDKKSLKIYEMLNSIYNEKFKDGKLCAELKSGKKTKIRSIKIWRCAAAGVALLIGVSALLYFMLRSPLNERLYNENFEPYSFAERSDQPDTITQFDKALIYFNSGNYEKSWAMMKNADTSCPSYIASLFVRGISAMEINKHDDAVIAFKKIIKDNSTRFIERAEWYIALCHLKKNDTDNAKIWFKKIAGSDSYFRNKAKNILERISE